MLLKRVLDQGTSNFLGRREGEGGKKSNNRHSWAFGGNIDLFTKTSINKGETVHLLEKGYHLPSSPFFLQLFFQSSAVDRTNHLVFPGREER